MLRTEPWPYFTLAFWLFQDRHKGIHTGISSTSYFFCVCFLCTSGIYALSPQIPNRRVFQMQKKGDKRRIFFQYKKVVGSGYKKKLVESVFNTFFHFFLTQSFTLLWCESIEEKVIRTFLCSIIGFYLSDFSFKGIRACHMLWLSKKPI